MFELVLKTEKTDAHYRVISTHATMGEANASFDNALTTCEILFGQRGEIARPSGMKQTFWASSNPTDGEFEVTLFVSHKDE